MTEDMKVSAIAPWFGGKRTMGVDIATELGKHTQYFEPFCGSMAVLFAKEPSQKETVNDLHGDLINLARVLQNIDTATDLYRRLSRTLFSEDLLNKSREILSISIPNIDDCGPIVNRAYWYFLASWMGRNGTAGTARADFQLAVRWTSGGGSPTVRWRNVIESIPAWHHRLRDVVILCRDAFKFLDKFEDTEKTAIYVDPPYFKSSRSSMKNGGGKGARYQHEFEAESHVKLLEILKGYKRARIVVSYYDCPEVRELYSGWTFVDHTRQKHLHLQNGRGDRKLSAPEVLIISGPSYMEDQPA